MRERTETLYLTGRELAMLCDATREHLEASEADLMTATHHVDPSVLNPLRSVDQKVCAAYARLLDRDAA